MARVRAGSRGRPRSVLFLHGSAVGYGADRQLEAIVTGLDPRRYRPIVVLPETGPLSSQLEDAGIEVHYAPLAILRRRLLHGRGIGAAVVRRSRSGAELARLARSRRVALVHSNSSILLSGQTVADRAGVPHVLHLREIYRGLAGRAGHALWPVLRARITRADAIACVSEAVAAQLDGHGRSFVVYDAAPHALVLPAREDARRALDIGADRFVVAMIGRISDWKGQDVFLRALAGSPLDEVGALGLVVGDSAPDQRHFERDLAALAETLALNGRVRVLGFRDDVAPILAAADAVAIPSRHADALPSVALEAAAARLPIVATPVGGLPEIVRDGVNGRLVPAGDHARLGAVLRELADAPADAASLGLAAAADVAARFGRETMLETLQERYDELLAAQRPTAVLFATPDLPTSQPSAAQLRSGRLLEWLQELGYEVSVRPSKPLRRLPLTIASTLRSPPTLALTNTSIGAPLLAALRLVRRNRVFLVADVMGLHSLEIDQATHSRPVRRLLRPIWKRLERRMCRAADLVLAVNDRHADLVRTRYRPAAAHTLRDAAEPELAEIVPTPRATLGIPADALAVGFLGSLVYNRLAPVFAAWESLAADGNCLVVVGDGPDLERYTRRAADAGWLGRSVVFLGSLPRREALAAIRACDVAYSDCWSEAGFPAKLFEYMALAMPIVAEGKRQIAEVLEENRDALFFRTPDELAARIRMLAADPPLRRTLGANARAKLVSAHTTERRRGEFEALVEPLPAAARSIGAWPDTASSSSPSG